LFEAESAKPVDPHPPEACPVPEPVYREVTRHLDGAATAATGTPVNDSFGNVWLVRHVAPNTPAFGVIAVDLGRAAGTDLDHMRGRVDGVLAEAAATLERMDVARVIDEARMRAEAEVLREALIGSVSHELRTPLASILGSATVLCNTPPVAGDERLAALANVIRDEAERLNSDIQNLLDATRITSKSVKPLRQWYEPADIVNSALERRGWRLADHVVVTDMGDDLPLIYVDPVLMQQALVQMIDNAAKYSPAGSTIAVTARRNGREIVLAVTDQGTGFTVEEREQLGERFFRGPRHLTTTPGSGLGLWIAKAFVTACDGDLAVVSGGANLGSTVSIHLPVADEAIRQLERAADE
jgi:two-component system sensor histidine kinase KdpD